MDFRELVVTRRTVHNYHSDPVPDSLVEESMRLSLWAPNHKLSFPWVYTLLGPEVRGHLADLAVELKSAKGDLTDVKRKAIRENVLGPSHVISLGLRRTPGKAAGSFDVHREHEDYATLACSVQIMSMHLWQHGVASKWSTGGWSMHEKTYGLLGLNPAEVRLEGCLLIGRAQGPVSIPERPDLSRFLRRV